METYKGHLTVEMYQSFDGKYHEKECEATASTIDSACEILDTVLRSVAKADNGADYLTSNERFSVVTKLFKTVEDVAAFSKAFAAISAFLEDCKYRDSQFSNLH